MLRIFRRKKKRDQNDSREDELIRDLKGYHRTESRSRRETRLSTPYGRYRGGDPYDVVVITKGEFEGRAYALSERENGDADVTRVE